MSFKVPDLIVESIIRDGLNNARRDETVIDDVFADLCLPFASKKYGQKEIEKIKEIVRNKEVSIVHSFNLVNANVPCISIQLADDREEPEKAHTGDYQTYQTFMFTDPDQIANLVVVSAFQPTSYDSLTGIVKVDDSVNLASVHQNLLFVDAAGTEHTILGGIDNDPGEKQFIIGKEETVDLGVGAEIKSSINYEVRDIDGNIETTHIILGIHTKEALFTKYLYTLVKYFMLSRKKDLTRRGFQLTTYSGSDFHRNTDYVGDVVYTRFFNVTGILQHSWRSDKVQLIDNVNVRVQIDKDRLNDEELGRIDQTVTVEDPED